MAMDVQILALWSQNTYAQANSIRNLTVVFCMFAVMLNLSPLTTSLKPVIMVINLAAVQIVRLTMDGPANPRLGNLQSVWEEISDFVVMETST